MTFQQFIAKYNGKFVEVAGPNSPNQCTDLANAYLMEVLGQEPIKYANAKDFPARVNDSWSWILNTPEGIPSPGDMVIWDGEYGHIAIFIDGDASRFNSFDQNYPAGTPAHMQSHTYLRPKVLGWLHPKENMDPLQECLTQHTKLVDEATQLKKTIETLKAEDEAFRVDVNNMKLAYEENIKKLNVQLDGKLLLETQLQQERDGRREDQLHWDMKRIDLEGTIEKLEQQLASDDLSYRDFRVLVNALLKNIARYIQSVK
jgi:hypothetical protein